jgi:shikimate kinase
MTALPGDMTSKSVPAARVRAIILVGFMGAGKSSVGAALGRSLNWPFEDLDQLIQAREKRSVEEIFRQSGEVVFRQLEHAALRSLVEKMDALTGIVALGGGAFAQAENIALLDQPGFVTVFLDAPVKELFRRCRQQQELDRPLRGNLEEFRKLYEHRRPRYLQTALRIETAGKVVEVVAAEVIARLRIE